MLHDVKSAPFPWTLEARAPIDQRLQFHIGLSSANGDLLQQILQNVSDPVNSDYGRYLDQKDIDEIIRPDDLTTNAVLSWLKRSGIATDNIDHHGDWMNFQATSAQAEILLNTTFSIFRNEDGNKQIVRTLRYSIPEELIAHIDTIQPTTKFPQIRGDLQPVMDLIRRNQEVDNSSIDCNQTITPACLKVLKHSFKVHADLY